MKKTNQEISNQAAAKAAEFEKLDAIVELKALVEQRATLERQVEQIPAQVATVEREIEEIGGKLVDVEMALLQVPEKEIPAAMKQRDALEKSQIECALRLKRLKMQLQALESGAPTIDAKIDLAIGYVRLDASIAAENMQIELASEIRQKVGELQMAYARVRALQRAVPSLRTSDFLEDAFIPDLERCVRINTGTGSYNQSPNLLSEKDDNTDRAEAEIAAALQPITAALAVGRAHRAYLPLNKRPGDYVFRGSNSGPQKGFQNPLGVGEPPLVSEPEPSPFKGYRTDEPYQIKGDMSGIRTRQAAAEMNMTAAIAEAAKSAEH